MKYLASIIMILLAFVHINLGKGYEYQATQWAVLCAGAIILICIGAIKKGWLNEVMIILIGYVCLQSTFIWGYHLNPYLQTNLAYSISTTSALMLIGVLATWHLFARLANENHFINTLAVIHFIALIYGFYQILSGRPPIGIMGNISLSGTLLAITMPTVIRSPKYIPYLIIPGIQIYLGHASVALMTYIVVISTILYFSFKPRWLKWLMALMPLAIVAIALLNIPELLDDQGRYMYYRSHLQVWLSSYSPLFGSGAGTFKPLAFEAQRTMAIFQPFIKEHGMQTWMMSDWLQIVYENGLIGIVLAILTAASLVIQNRHNHVKLAMTLGLMAAMTVGFPLRFAIFAPIILFVAVKD